MKTKLYFLITFFISCENSYRVNKDFDSFFDQFFRNEDFKKQRTKFPLKSIDSKKNKTQFLTEEAWLGLGKYNLMTFLEAEYSGLEFKLIAKNRVDVIFKIEEINERLYIIHRFKKINDKWYLYEIED
ncbi:MAG: hypothetical protein V4683_16040 [Bacteroidota bacterium]